PRVRVLLRGTRGQGVARRAARERLVAVHARLRTTKRTGLRARRVLRGGDRTWPAGRTDRVPAHDLRRVLAPRGHGHAAVGAGGHTADPVAGARTRAPGRLPQQPRPGLERVDAVVLRGVGDAYLARRARLLPVAQP